MCRVIYATRECLLSPDGKNLGVCVRVSGRDVLRNMSDRGICDALVWIRWDGGVFIKNSPGCVWELCVHCGIRIFWDLR